MSFLGVVFVSLVWAHARVLQKSMQRARARSGARARALASRHEREIFIRLVLVKLANVLCPVHETRVPRVKPIVV